MNYGFGQALLDSLVGIMVVFFALILLMCIIKIMTAIGDSREKKNAAAAAPAKAAEPAPVSAPPKKLAPGAAEGFRREQYRPAHCCHAHGHCGR